MIEILREPYVSLFVIMFFGLLLSKIEFKRISLGSSGIILSAIFFGHFGLVTPPAIEKIGLILFMFAVGIQAGPGFFESFKTGEAREYLLITTINLSIVFTLTILIGLFLNLKPFVLSGLFTGVTTSTPALAAIVENGKSPIPIVTYAISYPSSLIVTILLVRLLTKFLKIDIKAEEESYKRDMQIKVPVISSGYFRVENSNIFNQKISKLNLSHLDKSIISRHQKSGENYSQIVNENTLLQENDLVKIIGSKKDLEYASLLFGQKLNRPLKISEDEEIITILVTRSEVIGKALSELKLDELFGAEIGEVRRAGINIIPRGSTRLRYGDKILTSCHRKDTNKLVELLGGIESGNIDFLPISLAILLGVILGQFSINFYGTNFGVGITGGILFMTLVLGRLGKTGPMLWSLAGKTNQFLRDMGLMFFLCGVGSSTGKTLLSSGSDQNLKMILISVIVTSVSIIICAIICINFLKFNKLRILGAIAGSFTCSAALPSSKEINNSTIPLTAYSITYPFALLLTILFGQLFLFFN